MSMKVVYLKDTPDHKVGWEGFIPRTLGRTLCHQDITIPAFGKEKDARYIELLESKAREKADREAKENADREANAVAERKAKADKLLKDKEAAAKETAESKPAKGRSRAVKK